MSMTNLEEMCNEALNNVERDIRDMVEFISKGIYSTSDLDHFNHMWYARENLLAYKDEELYIHTYSED